MKRILAILAFVGTPAWAQSDCGPEAPCEIANGSYHMIAEPNATDPAPALVFFHGHNASGEMIFGGGIEATFADHGYVVIAPNGTPITGRSTYRWAGRNGGPRDDVAFTLDVVADAATRTPIDPERIYVAGFSAGGSMAWLMACKAAEKFAGFASIAGALRQPNDVTDCPSAPVRFLQIHGFSDNTVPFEGRALGDWHQGSIWDSLSLARTANACRSHPDRITVATPYRCRTWDDSCGAGAIRICAHDGGHGLPAGWTQLARDWFESRD